MVGDEVLSRDENNVNGPLEWKPVEETFIRFARIMNLGVRRHRLGFQQASCNAVPLAQVDQVRAEFFRNQQVRAGRTNPAPLVALGLRAPRGLFRMKARALIGIRGKAATFRNVIA